MNERQLAELQCHIAAGADVPTAMTVAADHKDDNQPVPVRTGRYAMGLTVAAIRIVPRTTLTRRNGR